MVSQPRDKSIKNTLPTAYSRVFNHRKGKTAHVINNLQNPIYQTINHK